MRVHVWVREGNMSAVHDAVRSENNLVSPLLPPSLGFQGSTVGKCLSLLSHPNPGGPVDSHTLRQVQGRATGEVAGPGAVAARGQL